MEKKDTLKIINKVKVYRPKFESNDFVVSEWHRVLESYDYEDVDKKLNEYLSDLVNRGRYPDPLYLTKYLKTSADKLNPTEYKIICDGCCKSIRRLEYKTHKERCNSALWLCDMSKKYFNKSLNYVKLMELEKSDFNERYYLFCKRLYELIEDGLEKRALETYIRVHEGKPAQYDVVKEICEAFEQ